MAQYIPFVPPTEGPGSSISGNIFAKCSPAMSTGIERCGAISLCDISPTTDDELAAIYADSAGRYRIMGALLEADFTGKACQIKQNGMYDWIMATHRDFGAKRLTASRINYGLYEVMPFIKMARKGPINNEFWTVAGGTAASGSGPNTGTAYTHRFDATSQTSVPGNVNWFPVSMRVYISGKSAGGSATRTAWRVVDSAMNGTAVRLYCVSENAASFLPAAKLEVPATGVLVRGTPNINDYEKYCPQIPSLNTNQLSPFWIESVRYAFCDDKLVNRYLKAIRDNNPLYRQFQDVESVEVNRQITEDFQRRHAWAFWFNKALANQTLTDWDNLEQITVFGDDAVGNYLDLPFEGRCIGRRANAIGIYELMAECGRVFDLQNQILNLPELFRALYTLKRMRESNGYQSNVFELITDSYYAVQLAQGLFRYFALKSEGLLRLNYDLSSKKEQNALGWVWTRFQLDWPNVELRIVTHPFFDDYVDAHSNVSAATTSSGRFLFILEWSGIYQAIIESNTVTNTSGNVQQLAAVNQNFECVMKVPERSRKLVSLTYTNVVECPAASMILENIDPGIPEHVQAVGSYDYYGDYTG
jgi:hypothetical protein